MLDAQDLRLLREEIRKQINIILFSAAGTTEKDREVIENAYPGSPGTDPRPIIQPYGFNSRAPRGTVSLHARIGEHVGNKTVLGHLDKDRPDLEEGESTLYNAFGQAIYMEDGAVRIGKKASSNPLVLGEQTKAMMEAILDTLDAHVHVSSAPGAAGSPPIGSPFGTIKGDFVDNDEILSQLVFTEKEA